jgi:hypothetical protein
MGFDLHIMLNLLIDENNGLAIVYKNGAKNVFDVSEYQVPAQYRRFILQRGHWFHTYVVQFEGNTISTDELLKHYPDWKDAVVEDDWTKEDHDEFKKALEWFAWKGNYIVTWSY